MNRMLGLPALLLVVVGCGAVAAQPVALPPVPTPMSALPASTVPAQPTQAQPMTTVHDPGQVTGHLRYATCIYRHSHGRILPDPACTPGSWDPQVTAQTLCSPGYRTRTYRPPVYQTARARYEVLGPAYSSRPGGELDHLVPLELGGSNDITNLWPEPGRIPNHKDAVENRLRHWVCAAAGATAQDRLHQAQLAIAIDWPSALRNAGAAP